jgi:hypothetical protein
VPVTIAVVRNEWSVGSDVGPEFPNRFQQLSLLLTILFEIQSKFQIVHNLEGLVNIPMPKIPFEALEVFFYFASPHETEKNRTLRNWNGSERSKLAAFHAPILAPDVISRSPF